MKPDILFFLKISFAALASAIGYYCLGYELDQANSLAILASFGLAFSGYFALVFLGLRFRVVFLIALATRLIFLFSTPTLSDDYHRFVFDGNLIATGYSPYSFLPSEVPDDILREADATGELLANMNSLEYYSVYPPLHQAIFAVGSVLGTTTQTSVLVIRAILLLADLALIVLLFFLLIKSGLKGGAAALYALNPLVITEITGNLHFEGLVALGLILTAWFTYRNVVFHSALAFAISVAFKLTPMIYGPAILRQFSNKRAVVWAALAAVIFGALGWWLVPLAEWPKIAESVGLYFASFEFNASVYYLARGVGIAILGYNPIATVGWLVPAVGAVIILYISWRSKSETLVDLSRKMMWVGLTYLLFATTVHPWYIVPLIALAVLAKSIVPLVWSLFIVLSYTAYGSTPVEENLWLVALEYSILALAIVAETQYAERLRALTFALWDENP